MSFRMKQSHFSMKLLTTCETVAYKEVTKMKKDELKRRIDSLKKIVTKDDEYEDAINQIVYYSLEIMEKILENTE